MKNQFKLPHVSKLESLPSALSIIFLSIFSILMPAYSQSVREAELPQEREIHNTFSRDQKNGALIDATNPMDLINRLRQATAMDNATSPSDAIDDALRAFDEKEPTKQISDPAR